MFYDISAIFTVRSFKNLFLCFFFCVYHATVKKLLYTYIAETIQTKNIYLCTYLILFDLIDLKYYQNTLFQYFFIRSICRKLFQGNSKSLWLCKEHEMKELKRKHTFKKVSMSFLCTKDKNKFRKCGYGQWKM